MRKSIAMAVLATSLIALTAWMTYAATGASNTWAATDPFNAFDVSVTANSNTPAVETATWVQDTLTTAFEVTMWTGTSNTGSLTFNLAWTANLTKAKIVIKLPEQVTVNTGSILAWTVFDQINKEETSLSGSVLTVSLFSTNPVLSNWKAFTIDFAVNPNTEKSMYNFEVDTLASSFTDASNNTLLAAPSSYSTELVYTMPVEVTEKEEWIAEVSLIALLAILSVYAYSQRRRTV